ncbi:unnamed protein product [Phytophthora fragariaefolia]|uniref:Unnamed protein product n=1 Tax=Phytophthora fragariaefolia TaxID=1490495 RepID=A0A9W7CT17_9STRA|nr:unnamed protein product [Phytophthora fragariaefolia]
MNIVHPGQSEGLMAFHPKASVPSSLLTASTGNASGESSESSLAQADDALSPVLGAAPRSAADAPEAASSANSAGPQPQRSVSSSVVSGDGACSAANAPEASSAAPGAPRFSSVRWEDIEDIVTAGTDRTVRQVLDHADAARQLVVTNIALEQRSQAAGVVEQRCRRLEKSLSDTHKVIRQDREQFKAGIASYAAQLREYLEQSDRQSSASGGTSSASASAMPAAFTTFLEELGAQQLAIPPPLSASGSSEASVPAPPASSGTSGGAMATSGP